MSEGLGLVGLGGFLARDTIHTAEYDAAVAGSVAAALEEHTQRLVEGEGAAADLHRIAQDLRSPDTVSAGAVALQVALGADAGLRQSLLSRFPWEGEDRAITWVERPRHTESTTTASGDDQRTLLGAGPAAATVIAVQNPLPTSVLQILHSTRLLTSAQIMCARQGNHAMEEAALLWAWQALQGVQSAAANAEREQIARDLAEIYEWRGQFDLAFEVQAAEASRTSGVAAASSVDPLSRLVARWKELHDQVQSLYDELLVGQVTPKKFLERFALLDDRLKKADQALRVDDRFGVFFVDTPETILPRRDPEVFMDQLLREGRTSKLFHPKEDKLFLREARRLKDLQKSERLRYWLDAFAASDDTKEMVAIHQYYNVTSLFVRYLRGWADQYREEMARLSQLDGRTILMLAQVFVDVEVRHGPLTALDLSDVADLVEQVNHFTATKVQLDTIVEVLSGFKFPQKETLLRQLGKTQRLYNQRCLELDRHQRALLLRDVHKPASAGAGVAREEALLATAEATMDRIADLNRSKEWRVAFKLFRKALEKWPDSLSLQINYASMCEELGLNEEASAIYRRVLALQAADSLKAPLLLNQGMLLMKLGEYQAAVAAFDVVMSLRPELLDAHYHRYVALVAQGGVPLADIVQAHGVTLVRVAELLVRARAGAFAEDDALLTRATELAASYFVTTTLHIEFLIFETFRTGQWHLLKLIADNLRQVVQILGKGGESLMAQLFETEALFHFGEGRYSEALPFYAKALERTPGDAAIRYFYAVALQFAGEPELARQQYQRIMVAKGVAPPLAAAARAGMQRSVTQISTGTLPGREFPVMPRPFATPAFAATEIRKYLQAGHPVTAMTLATGARRIFPDDETIIVLQTEAYFQEGVTAPLIENVRRLLRSGNDRLVHQLADHFFAVMDKQLLLAQDWPKDDSVATARQVAQIFHEHDPHNINFTLMLAELAERDGRITEAQHLYREIFDRYPRSRFVRDKLRSLWAGDKLR